MLFRSFLPSWAFLAHQESAPETVNENLVKRTQVSQESRGGHLPDVLFHTEFPHVYFIIKLKKSAVDWTPCIYNYICHILLHGIDI